MPIVIEDEEKKRRIHYLLNLLLLQLDGKTQIKIKATLM